MQFPRRPPARWVLAFTVGVVLAATAGCTSDHPEKAAQRQDTASVPFADPIDSQTPGAGPHLTGFGATRHEWNNNHTEIPGSSPGSTYDRDPNIITDSGRPGIRYVTVSTEGGRVTKYQFNFPSHTDTDSALAKLRQEFPPDVQVLWQQEKDTCYEVEFKSATLGQALADPRIGDGQGMVLATLGSDGDGGYLAGQVAFALLMVDATTTADNAPGCFQ